MSKNWDFQHVHFLTRGTMTSEVSNMLSLIFLCICQILETFKSKFKSTVANNCDVQNINL